MLGLFVLLASSGRYTILASYVVCFYDWIISLGQEVALIYSAPWNAVKAAYVFCRYYPMAIAPFHLWGLVGDHEQHFCESYYHALFACAMPTMLSVQLILMFRTYAFSGRKNEVLAILSISFIGLVGVIIWVTSKKLTLPLLFISSPRNGCFAVSDQPTLDELLVAVASDKVPVPISYHMGILTTSFDCLNMFIVIWHCVQRGTLGMLVYVLMTALNGLTIASYFSPYLVLHGLVSGSELSFILPSSLVTACRLVFLLRRKASPTQTELRVQYSHMIDEAQQMIPVARHPEHKSEGLMPFVSTDVQAQA
ncbi:hypothetical protein V8E53_006822 [Lactarius tabidus]